jgi:hypothetical protein
MRDGFLILSDSEQVGRLKQTKQFEKSHANLNLLPTQAAHNTILGHYSNIMCHQMQMGDNHS